MTLPDPAARARTREHLLAAVARIRPILAADAAAGETERTLPAASLAALRETNLFALKTPACLGGYEADPMLQVEVIEAVTAIDASIGWNVCIGNGGLSMTGYLPDEAIAALFQGGRIPTVAGAFKPGRATATPEGYRVSGRWGWASGVRHAEWVGAHVLVERGAGTPPESRYVLLPASALTLHDTWHVAGLKGTGSGDFSVTDHLVPEGFSFDLLAMVPRRGGPLYRQGFPGLLINEFMGFALGVARRVHEEFVAVVKSKQRGYGPRVATADRGVVQRVIGESELRLRATRLMVFDALEQAWAKVCAGQTLEMADQLLLRGVTVSATDMALDLVAQANRYAGGDAIFLSHPLQRYLRDMQTAAAHLFVSDSAYELWGQHLLGRAVPDPMGG